MFFQDCVGVTGCIIVTVWVSVDYHCVGVSVTVGRTGFEVQYIQSILGRNFKICIDSYSSKNRFKCIRDIE